MNVQLSALSAASVETTAARTVPLPGTGGSADVAAAHPTPQAKAPQPMSGEAAQQVAQQVNQYLKDSKSSLQFEVDGASKKVVVRIVDSDTKELIRQIPSEEMLEISRSLDKMTGLLLAQKA